MVEWRLTEQDLKRYPHFDSPLPASEAEALALDPNRVATHRFFPFVRYVQRWTRWAPKGDFGKVKERPIRYAARRDAYIFSRYRHLLSEYYERELERMNLQQCILAYRRIPDESGHGGKCNIHFARDAFRKIRQLGNCGVITLDISSYFECLDHARLKQIWCRLIGESSLPVDHHQVFKAMTRYAVVDKEEVYERLGYFGVKSYTKNGRPIKGFLVDYNQIPRRLCSDRTFREKIAGGDGTPTAIKKNFKPYGIPQGAPISDLLANLYLIDFDFQLLQWIAELGGNYYRYSDDIMIVLPGGATESLEMLGRVQNEIRNHGKKLRIKDEKSYVVVFCQAGRDQSFERVFGKGGQGRNGLEYLGFRYNGRLVYIKDSTLQNLGRRETRAARRRAIAAVKRYPDKTADEIRKMFNYEELIKRFGRAEEFGEMQHEYRNWTFWTYSKRAVQLLEPLGRRIPHQLKRRSGILRRKANDAIDRAVLRRDNRGPETEA